jgi:hypothetical protein
MMHSPFLFDPPSYILVDVLPVAYSEDINDLTFDFEYNSVISHPELPEPSQILP